MKIVNLQDQSPEWLAWRRSGIGSSDIAAIIGKSPWKTAKDVYDEKKGLESFTYLNPAMLKGNMHEGDARKAFESYKGSKFFPACIEHNKYEYFHASLDGYNSDTKEFVELKVPGSKNLEKIKKGEIPEYYYLQVQWQMLVGGFSGGYFATYSPEDKEIYIIHLEKDSKCHDLLQQEAVLFWENLLKDIPPPLQQSDYIEIEDPEAIKIAEEYIDLDEKIKELERQKKRLKEEIIDFGDGGNFRLPNLTVYMKPGPEVLDKDKMIADGIDLSLYKKPANWSYTIRKRK